MRGVERPGIKFSDAIPVPRDGGSTEDRAGSDSPARPNDWTKDSVLCIALSMRGPSTRANGHHLAATGAPSSTGSNRRRVEAWPIDATMPCPHSVRPDAAPCRSRPRRRAARASPSPAQRPPSWAGIQRVSGSLPRLDVRGSYQEHDKVSDGVARVLHLDVVQHPPTERIAGSGEHSQSAASGGEDLLHALRIDRCGRHDDAKLRTPPLRQTEEHVRREGMPQRLDRGEPAQHRDAREVLGARAQAAHVAEANRASDVLADLGWRRAHPPGARTQTRPRSRGAASRRPCGRQDRGICVVYPHPVSLTMTTTVARRCTSHRTSRPYCEIGRMRIMPPPPSPPRAIAAPDARPAAMGGRGGRGRGGRREGLFALRRGRMGEDGDSNMNPYILLAAYRHNKEFVWFLRLLCVIAPDFFSGERSCRSVLLPLSHRDQSLVDHIKPIFLPSPPSNVCPFTP